MKAPAIAANDESVLRRLAENDDESAAAAILAQLCRQSPELRHWLWEDFGRDARVRAKFAQFVKDGSAPPLARFADLTDDGNGLREEQRRLRERFPAGVYGGLTWNQVVTLIRHHQSGTIDVGAFLLAQAWRESGEASPLLMWAGTEFLDRVIPSGRRRLLKHLDRALGLLKRCENKAKRRAIFGYADWWKLNVLLYLLRHPKPSYRTRELRAHLSTLGLEISTKDMRRFCSRHGIRRDMRA
ncbi:MAG: hypothetical protein ACREFX_08040, partial [Opitutaceae bacterium]